jgi:hypothetical protein
MNSLSLVIVDTDTYVLANEALRQSLKFKVDEVVVISDTTQCWDVKPTKIIPKINSFEEYNRFVLFDLHQYIKTSHFIMIQYDGFIINPNEWSQLFWHYDYIGAPWPQESHGPHNVGNGGFSFRSKKLMNVVQKYAATSFDPALAEDLFICRGLRPTLESNDGIYFADQLIAGHFSAEYYRYRYPTFGFHNIRLMPEVYKDRLDYLLDNLTDRVVRQSGSIMMPFLEVISAEHARKLLDRIQTLQ